MSIRPPRQGVRKSNQPKTGGSVVLIIPVPLLIFPDTKFIQYDYSWGKQTFG